MRRAIAAELLDEGPYSGAELSENFRDIERANRWLGGVGPVVEFIRRHAAQSVLDVGCGSADIARALLRDAARRGAPLHVTCLDRNPDVLALARSRCGAEVAFVQGDGASLPFDDAAFDIVTCSLTLHHCEPTAAVGLLREMRRVARAAPLVCDLRRSAGAYAGALALAFLFTRNRLTRHDAPLSVRRAYTPAEAAGLARHAGWRRPSVRETAFFRFALFDA